MEIKTLVVGELETNCYLIVQDGKCLIIDPGAEETRILKEIELYQCLGILLTHRHFDHIGALDQLVKEKQLDIYDFDTLKEPSCQIGPFNFNILHTPGHTKDSITFYFESEKVMFTGDFLFYESIGRTDFPGGNRNEMQESLKQISLYSSDISIYPGHGPSSTLEYEQKYNFFLTSMI